MKQELCNAREQSKAHKKVGNVDLYPLHVDDMTNHPAVDCVPVSTLTTMGRVKGLLKCSRALIFPETGAITPMSAGNMPLSAIRLFSLPTS